MNLFISSGISGKLVFARALKCMLQAILRVEVSLIYFVAVNLRFTTTYWLLISPFLKLFHLTVF